MLGVREASFVGDCTGEGLAGWLAALSEDTTKGGSVCEEAGRLGDAGAQSPVKVFSVLFLGDKNIKKGKRKKEMDGKRKGVSGMRKGWKKEGMEKGWEWNEEGMEVEG